MAVLLHKVAAGKLPLIVTSCIIISCVKAHYFRSAFRSTFLRSGFHSCPGAKGFPGTKQVVHQTNQVVRTMLKRPGEHWFWLGMFQYCKVSDFPQVTYFL